MQGEFPSHIHHRESCSELREQARWFRKLDNPAEKRLWSVLHDRRLDGLKFRRQVPLGPFIVDFYCAERRLIVEVDGPIHEQADVQEHDQERAAWLQQHGLQIVRLPAKIVQDDLPRARSMIRQGVQAHQISTTDIPSPAARERVPERSEGG